MAIYTIYMSLTKFRIYYLYIYGSNTLFYSLMRREKMKVYFLLDIDENNMTVTLLIQHSLTLKISYYRGNKCIYGKSRTRISTQLNKYMKFYLIIHDKYDDCVHASSVVQPLDQGVIIVFKLRYKSKLLEWVSSFHRSLIQINMIEKRLYSMLNKQFFGVTSLVKFRSWQIRIIWKCWWKYKILPHDWSANFAYEDQWEKSRVTKESKNLALLISNLQLGQDEMPLEGYLIMKGEDIIVVEYCMSKLVDMGSRTDGM